MSRYYDSDRQAIRGHLLELRKIALPSDETLSRMMAGCRDKEFRRIMELAFEGPRRSRMKFICDIASELPWYPTQELSSHDGFVSKVLIGVGIIAGLGLTCFAAKRQSQVCQIIGEKRKRKEDEEAEIGFKKVAREKSESGNKQGTLKRGQMLAISSRDIPPPPSAPETTITKPVLLPKARSARNVEEMAPTPHTPPPYPSASAYPLLNLKTLTPLRDIMAFEIADNENDEDKAELEATDLVIDIGKEVNNNDNDTRQVDEDQEAEDAEADVAKSNEEDGSNDDQDLEHKDSQIPPKPVNPTTTTDSPLSPITITINHPAD